MTSTYSPTRPVVGEGSGREAANRTAASGPGRLGRLGVACATHFRRLLIGWLVVLVGLGAFAPQAEKSLAGAGWHAVGSDSVQARDIVQREFDGLSSTALQVVVSADQPLSELAQTERVYRQAQELLDADPRVSEVFLPEEGVSVSADGRTAVLRAGAAGDSNEMVEAARDLKAGLTALSGDGVDVEVTGSSAMWSDFNESNMEAMLRSEMFSWPVTMIILVLAFGSLVAAGLPLMLTMAGLMASAGILHFTTYAMPTSIWAMNFAMMFSMALGIDYALFIVMRFRAALAEQAADEPDPVAAVARVMDTAGKAVLFSGLTVLVSLSAVMLVPSPAFRSMALGIILSVLFVLTATLTLLPAVLALLGRRIDRWHVTVPNLRRRRSGTERRPWRMTGRYQPQHRLTRDRAGRVHGTQAAVTGHRRPRGPGGEVWRSRVPVLTGGAATAEPVPAVGGSGTSAAWARLLWRRPLLIGGLGLAALLALSLPLSGLRTGMPSVDVIPAEATARIGFDQVRDAFGEGTAGSLQVLTPAAGATATQRVLDADPGVATVLPSRDSADRAWTLTELIPTAPPSSEELTSTIERLRDHLPDTALVGGAPAESYDLEAALAERTGLVIAVVLALSFLLMLVALHALLVSLLAVVTNLLAVAATFGIARLIFQEGWGEQLLGFDSQGFLNAWGPVFFFAMIFAISMDYTIFFLSSAKEHWDRSHDPQTAVVAGLAHSGRVIFAAGAVMVAVFFTFALSGPLPPKEMGVILGLAVLLDTFVVRLMLLPVLMRLTGRAAWWSPRWLRKLLPTVSLSH